MKMFKTEDYLNMANPTPGDSYRPEILTAEQLGLPKAVVELCRLSKGLVLVTGPTGSGKTTLMALLLRLFDPQEGVIEIDGLDEVTQFFEGVEDINEAVHRVNTEADVDRIVAVFPEIVASLRRLSPYWDVEAGKPRDNIQTMF